MDAEVRGAGAPRVSAVGVSVRYGERRVLDGLTIDVAPGEVFGVLGPNGAGKTTAFHVLAGLLEPDAGAVLVDGEPLGRGDGRLRQRLGVVFQQPSLDTRLTARENLLLGAALYRVPRRLARERAAELLSFAELEDRADEAVKRFSGGMKRRPEICRARLHAPEVPLLDEPTSGLDEGAFQRTWERLLELRRTQGLTILVTTHRAEEAERCDRLVILDRGVAIACDTPARLKQRVAGDVLLLDAERADELASELRARFGIEARSVDHRVVLEHPRGHELIPRLVESLPPGRLRSVSLHRPTLAEVFLHLTGRALEEVRPT